MNAYLDDSDKYERIKKKFCFYLDIPDRQLSGAISRRLEDMGLREEVFLTSQVTHVIGNQPTSGREVGRARCVLREGRARADAMLERLRPQPPSSTVPHTYVHLTVPKAVSLLDKLYDRFLEPSRRPHVYFSKHFIKIEFLDKACKPVYKEFDEWPQILIEPEKEKKDIQAKISKQIPINIAKKMTRKSRPRIKEKEDKDQKGYCEMCNTEYADAALHRRSPHHLAFIRDHTNFLALDSLISSGADVSTFLDKANSVNGERRSLRKLCNGDSDTKGRRSMRSQSPDNINGDCSPKRNGGLEDERKHNTRCSKKSNDSQPEDRQYYKVVGVSTKLRSSGGFAKRKESPPACNGTKPLVVKFRKVRRSELSVLSDEAEQFMFPKRASSTSSTSSDEDDDEDGEKDEPIVTRRKTPPQPPPPLIERQRLARPIALKEESSEEDSWPEDKRRRKRRAPAGAKRSRRVSSKLPIVETVVKEPEELIEQPALLEGEISPLREEPTEKCMKWEDGRLKYTPAVEQLEFAFESVPHSEPWFETFKRQDQDKLATKNVSRFFELFSKSPKLPYEIGQLPPLKPNCCPLSDLIKRDEKPGPSRSYGTRGMKKQKIRKRTATIQALEAHPRKSPREHASTLAILGSAGLLHRRKHTDDTKSTASEDTVSDTHSNIKIEPVISETQEASERLKQFLSEVYDDPIDYDVLELMGGDSALIASKNVPNVSNLVSECEDCDIIRNEINNGAEIQRWTKRGRFKKKNKTGWPNKKKHTKKNSRASSMETDHKGDSSLDRSSVELPDDDTTQSSISEDDHPISEFGKNESTLIENLKSDDSQNVTAKNSPEAVDTDQDDKMSEDQPLSIAIKELMNKKCKNELEKEDKVISRSSASESEDKEEKNKKKKRVMPPIGDWLQPVVRVARVDPTAGRRLRSAGKSRSNRFR